MGGVLAQLLFKAARCELPWAQIRRVECERCGRPFGYLATGVVKKNAIGFRLLSSDEKLLDVARQMARATLRSTVWKKRDCHVNCPHCRRPQWRGLLRSARNDLVAWGLIGFWIAMLVTGLLQIDVLPGTGDAVLLAGAGMGGVLGVGVGALVANRSFRRFGEPDDRARGDPELLSHLTRCRREDRLPAVAWAEEIDVRPQEQDVPVVDLGSRDDVGGVVVPDRVRSESVVGALAATRRLG